MSEPTLEEMLDLINVMAEAVDGEWKLDDIEKIQVQAIRAALVEWAELKAKVGEWRQGLLEAVVRDYGTDVCSANSTVEAIAKGAQVYMLMDTEKLWKVIHEIREAGVTVREGK